MAPEDANRRLIEQFWQDLYRRDLDKVGSYFAPDGHYRDVPAPDPGAFGPEQVAARLRLGLLPIEGHAHHIRNLVAQGHVVMTEHDEEWRWHTGESVVLPFVSVHEIQDGKITRWWDYWDMPTLMNAAPAWWIEYIMSGGTAPIPGRTEDSQ